MPGGVLPTQGTAASPEHFESAFDEAGGIQFSATELLEAIAYLREVDDEQRPTNLAQLWEEGCDDGLTDVLDQIYAVA